MMERMTGCVGNRNRPKGRTRITTVLHDAGSDPFGVRIACCYSS
jgi:hypothetical protein